jgi:cytochrome c biogenesis protein ccsA
MSFSFSSCSESDPNLPTNETTEVNLEKVTQQYVNDVVFVTYSKLADQSEQLFNKLEASRAKLNAGQTVNQSEIDALCDNYKEARKIWEASEAFFYGAAEEKNIDPQITHVMPVLNSPLLAIHVSIIMMGYALLAFTFVCSLTSLVLYLLHRKSTDVQQQNIKALQMLSMLFLLPALVALCYGIFIGAIWANISWGQYWSWDPKETWALITLMVYAVPVHFFYSKHQHAPLFYHIYMLLAFSTVLMTYFGVNYFLGGMHSYA